MHNRRCTRLTDPLVRKFISHVHMVRNELRAHDPGAGHRRARRCRLGRCATMLFRLAEAGGDQPGVDPRRSGSAHALAGQPTHGRDAGTNGLDLWAQCEWHGVC